DRDPERLRCRQANNVGHNDGYRMVTNLACGGRPLNLTGSAVDAHSFGAERQGVREPERVVVMRDHVVLIQRTNGGSCLGRRQNRGRRNGSVTGRDDIDAVTSATGNGVTTCSAGKCEYACQVDPCQCCWWETTGHHAVRATIIG